VLFDCVHQVEGGFRETLALDMGADVTIDWPGVLVARLEAVRGEYGMHVQFTPPDEPLDMEDRHVARLVLDDLTVNAAKSGALTAAVTLERRGDRYHASVRDDGRPFLPGMWMRPGGGLERLAALLEAKAGSLRLQEEPRVKTVTATWRGASRAGEGELRA
jgi:signal transduction histidine kinase